MIRLTPEEMRDVERIFHRLFQLSQFEWSSLEADSVFCVELPISFRGYVVTASFTGGKNHIMLGIGRLFDNNDDFSYSSYSHARLKKGSFYRHVSGTFLLPENFGFELKYAPLHSKNHATELEQYINAFVQMHDSLRSGEFLFHHDFFPAFFGMFDANSLPKLSL